MQMLRQVFSTCPDVTTIATKKQPIYFSNEIGKMKLRSAVSDWLRWQLKQKFAIVDGKTKAVDVNPSLSAIGIYFLLLTVASTN